MGRKQHINEGAGAACVVVGVIVGIATQSFWGGVVAWLGITLILMAIRIIR